jgi:hypothetical protein
MLCAQMRNLIGQHKRRSPSLVKTNACASSFRVRANERRILELKYTEYTLDWSARLRDDLPTNHPQAKSRHLKGRKRQPTSWYWPKLCAQSTPLQLFKKEENEASHTPQAACCE